MTALGEDPERHPVPADVDAARDALIDAARRFATTAELLAAVRNAGLAGSPIRPFTELAASEWAAYRGLLAHAAPGVSAPAAPWRSSTADIGIRRPAGALGADTDAVLSELIGLGSAEIAQLRSEGVVAGPSRPE
jgi:crotonobetainyl-CoA:carnitine CoA-transferase CaiB-like acyl-CoA transferase